MAAACSCASPAPPGALVGAALLAEAALLFISASTAACFPDALEAAIPLVLTLALALASVRIVGSAARAVEAAQVLAVSEVQAVLLSRTCTDACCGRGSGRRSGKPPRGRSDGSS